MVALLDDPYRALDARADPVRALPMQRYMKSAIPYLGLSAPTLDTICRAIYARHTLPTFTAYDDYQRMSALPIYRELIVTGRRSFPPLLTGRQRQLLSCLQP